MVLFAYNGISMYTEATIYRRRYAMSGGLQEEREREYEKQIRHEQNALTLMPLPVRIKSEWFDLMPKVLHLITDGPDNDLDRKYLIKKEISQSFLEIWEKRLMMREEQPIDGTYWVWIHLGGLEANNTIPNFCTAIESKITMLDKDLREEGGLEAIVEFWRSGIPELENANTLQVLDARKKILYAVEALMSTVTLSGCWAHAFERARDNILKIRPVVENWINTQGRQWDLDKPFGGKIEDTITERLN